MGGQFTPESRWSVCSGKWPEKGSFKGGQFAPESGGQFDRILQVLTGRKLQIVILHFL
jgi:hypothetical protein